MTHLHYEFLAFDEKSETGHYLKAVQVGVVDCTTEAEAFEKAKKIVVRKQYVLHKAWECATCSFNEEDMATRRYMAALLSKHLGHE